MLSIEGGGCSQTNNEYQVVPIFTPTHCLPNSSCWLRSYLGHPDDLIAASGMSNHWNAFPKLMRLLRGLREHRVQGCRLPWRRGIQLQGALFPSNGTNWGIADYFFQGSTSPERR